MYINYFKIIFLILSFLVSTFIFISCKSVGSNPNIINGKFVDDKYPTVVRLIQDREEEYDTCSSIIVSNNVILTAAHCLVNEGDTYALIGEDQMIKGSSNVYFDEVKKGINEEIRLEPQWKNITDLYIDRKIDRSEYENKVHELLKDYKDVGSYDLAAVIFDDIDGVPPFKFLIDKAKREGVFFQLSKNRFEDGTVLKKNENSLFFLGFGFSGKSKDLSRAEVVFENTERKQIGYNSFTYEKNLNGWKSPEPIKNGKNDSLLVESNAFCGDSGGPLIYNNQIIAVISGARLYDCEGSYAEPGEILSDKFLGKQDDGTFLYERDEEKCNKDSCCGKIKYASSRYASITLGNPIVETFLKKVKDELSKKGLLNSNSIFSELLEK